MSVQMLPAVTSAEFVRNFSQWRLKAASTPVVISNHGRNTHALISYERFVAATAPPGNAAIASDDLSCSAAELIDELRDGVIMVDADARIISVNRAVCHFARVKADVVIGQPMHEAFPALEGSYVHNRLLRALQTGERYSGDAASILRAGAWLRLDIVPVTTGAALVSRDITDEIAAFRLADTKQAIVRAMELDGHIGTARLALDETIERVDRVLAEMLGVDGEAILRMPVTALMPEVHRAAFSAAAAAAVMGGPQKLEAAVLDSAGNTAPVTLSIVAVHGAYAVEGLVVVVTRC